MSLVRLEIKKNLIDVKCNNSCGVKSEEKAEVA